MSTKLKVSIIYLIFLLLTHNLYSEKKINLAVADFDGINVSAMDAAAIGDLLRTELVNSGKFTVVDRSNMQQILAEQKFQMTGCTSQECAIKMGRLLNVQEVVVGKVMKIGNRYIINVNMINVETSQIVKSGKVKSDSIETLTDKIEELASYIVTPDYSEKAKVQEKQVEYISPEAPFFLTVDSVSEDEIDLFWIDNSDNEKGFEIERKIKGEEYTQIVIVGANINSYNDKDLKSNTRYFYRIRAYNDTGNSSYSNVRYTKTKRKIVKRITPFSDKIKKLHKKQRQSESIGINICANGRGGGIYYEHIYKSKIGIYFELGSYEFRNNLGRYLDSYYDPGLGKYVYYYNYGVEFVYFIYPALCKYYFNPMKSESFYIGLGLAFFHYNRNYSDSYNLKRTSLVLNFGMDIYARGVIHWRFDLKSFQNSPMNRVSLTTGLSINW